MTLPLASRPARLRLIEAVPFGSQARPSCRMYCTRTGRPRCFDSIGGIGRGVALLVAAVGAGAEHPDRAHLLLRQAEQLGDAIGGVVGLLRRGPDRRLAVAHVGDRAGRPHAGMRLRREFVLALDDADGLLDAFLEIAVLALELALDDRRLADVLEQPFVTGKVRLRVRPGHLERTRGLDRIPFLLGDDGEQVLDPDRPSARQCA